MGLAFRISLFINFILILLLALVVVFKTNIIKISSKPDSYYKKLNFLNTIKIKPNSIIFIGNSIIEQGSWNSISEELNIYNFGIGHDDVKGLNKRINKVLVPNTNKLFIMIGTNDLAKGKEINTIINDYFYLFDKLEKYKGNINIYFFSILPSSDSGGRTNDRIKKVNNFIKNQCLKRGYRYIDLYKIFIYNGIINPLYTTDGVHLNVIGYNKWISIIKEFFNK
jgi:lysophospholipase L1-like esterase